MNTIEVLIEHIQLHVCKIEILAAFLSQTIYQSDILFEASYNWGPCSIHLGHTLAAYATPLLKGNVIEQSGHVMKDHY